MDSPAVNARGQGGVGVAAGVGVLASIWRRGRCGQCRERIRRWGNACVDARRQGVLGAGIANHVVFRSSQDGAIPVR